MRTPGWLTGQGAKMPKTEIEKTNKRLMFEARVKHAPKAAVFSKRENALLDKIRDSFKQPFPDGEGHYFLCTGKEILHTIRTAKEFREKKHGKSITHLFDSDETGRKAAQIMMSSAEGRPHLDVFKQLAVFNDRRAPTQFSVRNAKK